LEGSEYLLTCAEIGVALAGFAALVVAIRQRGAEPLPPLHRGLVALLIERGLVATFLSLLPILISGLGVSTRVLWLSSSLSFALYGLSMAWRSAANRGEIGSAGLVPSPAFNALMLVGVLIIALQVAHAFGLGLSQSVWWYSVGVTWLLASAAYLFFFTIRDWMRAS
jgi:hypothetical protein